MPDFVPKNEEEMEALKRFYETGDVGALNSVGLSVTVQEIHIQKIVRDEDLQLVENERLDK